MLDETSDLWRNENFTTFEQFRVDTKDNFPSDKFTLNIGELTRSKYVQWVIFMLKLNRKNDVELLLEDSRRKFNINVCVTSNMS